VFDEAREVIQSGRPADIQSLMGYDWVIVAHLDGMKMA